MLEGANRLTSAKELASLSSRVLLLELALVLVLALVLDDRADDENATAASCPKIANWARVTPLMQRIITNY